MDIDLLVITGPTTSGKTKLAVKLASKLNGEIISADSRQVYKHMDIGTGKDLDEYAANGQSIPYHLIDVKEAGDAYSVTEFQRDFSKTFDLIRQKEKFPVLAGGTGLYLEAVLKGFTFTFVPANDPLRRSLSTYGTNDLLKKLKTVNNLNIAFDTSTKKRLIRAIEICEYLNHHPMPVNELVPFNYKILCINTSREEIKRRIKKRLKERLDKGMIEEVQSLLSRGISSERLKYYGLEYKYVMYYLEGQMNYNDLYEGLNIAIRQYAKRQMTWFRRMQRHGFEIVWLEDEGIDKMVNKTLELLRVR